MVSRHVLVSFNQACAIVIPRHGSRMRFAIVLAAGRLQLWATEFCRPCEVYGTNGKALRTKYDLLAAAPRSVFVPFFGGRCSAFEVDYGRLIHQNDMLAQRKGRRHRWAVFTSVTLLLVDLRRKTPKGQVLPQRLPDRGDPRFRGTAFSRSSQSCQPIVFTSSTDPLRSGSRLW
jgi:hypothetical protein